MVVTSVEIDALLPQTQCQRCGYPDCRSYAEAIAEGAVAHNRCAPGGSQVMTALSTLLQKPEIPLYHTDALGMQVAVIDEDACIGCTHCLSACPVDAIVGARHWMHRILETECTGCGLCVAPCPMDCITLHHYQLPQGVAHDSNYYRERYRAKQARLTTREIPDKAIVTMKTQAAGTQNTDIKAYLTQLKQQFVNKRSMHHKDAAGKESTDL